MATSKKKIKKHAEKAVPVQPLIPPPDSVLKIYPVLDDFLAYPWKHVAPRHAFGAYALSLYANLPDYIEVATEALTEGNDDKDVDLCLLDREAGEAYIAQCYVSNTWNKDSASTNKADDLLTGLSWLLNQSIKDIPEGIRKKAVELQDALQKREVTHVHLLYIHNCKESKAGTASLNTVAASARTLIQSSNVTVTAKEIGLPWLQHLFNSLTKQIAVEDTCTFDVSGIQKESGTGWEAYQTTIEGVELHDLWQKYGDDLFSANIRGFLDMLGRKTSINKGILDTVTQSPSRFWAFNNGVTILTKRIRNSPGKLEAFGVSIINGAQTSGVLGNAPREAASKVRVPCRFIQSSDKDLISLIIRCNNTQNAIRAFDFKSNDPVQRRLQIEFAKYNIDYIHRREGASRLKQGAVQAETIAPYLAAFHANFQVAIRQRRTIFEDMSTYSSVFPSQVTAEHVYLVQALADAVNEYKLELNEKVETGSANDPEKVVHQLLSYSTAKLFVIAVLGRAGSLILDRPLADLFAWRASAALMKPDRGVLISIWKSAVDSLLPLIVSNVGDDVYAAVRSTEGFANVAKKLSLQVMSLKAHYIGVLAPIRDATEVA